MRKQFFAFISMTAAAVAVLSCAKVAEIKDEAVDNTPAKGAITVNVRAGEDMTRTMAVDGEIPTIQWTANDKVTLFEVVDGAIAGKATSEAADIDGEGRASFRTTLDWADAGTTGSTYKYSAVYPADAVLYALGQHLLLIPQDQYLVGNNFSEDSDLLISTVLDCADSRVADDEDLMFSFRRVGTVVRLRLKGIPAGEKISQVTLQAPVSIAGAIVYDPVTGNVNPETVYDYYDYDTVHLYADDLEATGDDVVWFRVMCDEDWVAGDKFFITVVTDQGAFWKEVTLPTAIHFPDGGLTKFGVDLSESLVDCLTVPVLWDFEDDAPGWTFTDEDGDGEIWEVATGMYSHSGNHVLRSRSYNGTALTPDNWAYTPQVLLTEGNYLSFWIRAQDVDYPAEHYAVYIESASGERTPLIEENEYPDGDFVDLGEDGYYQRFVFLIPSAYDNQIVRIVFRHFNCEDQFVLNLDDVEILEEMPGIYLPAYEDYLGEWTDGNKVFTIEQAVEGSTYTISGFAGQQYPVVGMFQHNRLFIYEQVVASDGTDDLALQGLGPNSNNGLSWYTDLSSLNILFMATYNPDTGGLDITPMYGFSHYVWSFYTDEELTDYGSYAAIPGDLLPYVYVPDTNTYIYQEDFENGIDGWSFFDRNGDTYEWSWASMPDYAHSGEYVLWSRSWVSNTVGAVTPDNYVFTPAITLTNDNYLSFWVTADQSWYAEHYAVYVTTEAPSADNLPTENPIFEQTYSTSATVGGNLVELGLSGYQHYVISLAEYAGQTVYIGFRHFDCNDQNYLMLDDVDVTEGAPVIASAPANAAARKAPAQRMQSRSMRKDVPKTHRLVLDNAVEIKSR